MPSTKRIPASDLALVYEKLETGYVLHAPSNGWSDLTLPHEDAVDYEVEGIVYSAILVGMQAASESLQSLAHVFLREPGCGGTWCVVDQGNSDALVWQADPASEPPPPEDE